MLANPPFGVEWKKVQTFIEDEAARGYAGRPLFDLRVIAQAR